MLKAALYPADLTVSLRITRPTHPANLADLPPLLVSWLCCLTLPVAKGVYYWTTPFRIHSGIFSNAKAG